MSTRTKKTKAPVVEVKPEVDTEKKRVQLSTVLSINISQARCATHLKQNLGDAEVEEEIKALRDQLKALKEVPADDARVVELKAKIAEKSKSRVRISSETPIAAAVIWDGAVKELLRHGMDRAMADNKRIVESAHLQDGDPKSLVHYPLYAKCNIWSGYSKAFEDELKQQRTAANKVAKEARDAKKAEAKKAAEGAAVEAPKKPAAKPKKVEPEEDDEEEDEHTKTTFCTYVENALKTVKKDEKYKAMRVSNRVREYLSELVAQGLARQARLARIIVQSVMDVRTMNASHVKAVVTVLMADEGRTDEQVAAVTSQIDEKLEVFHKHLKAVSEEKFNSLPQEKKDELERKKRETELTRKRKLIDGAKERSAKEEQRTKALAEEVAQLEKTVA